MNGGAVAPVREGDDGNPALVELGSSPRWSRIARLHDAPSGHALRAAELVRSVAEGGAAEGRPLTVAIVAGPWRSPSVPGVCWERSMTVGVAPGLHLLVLEVAGPRAMLALRTGRAALLEGDAPALQRIGVAWGLGPDGVALLEAACTSLAVASLRIDGVGPLLGRPAPPGRSAVPALRRDGRDAPSS